MDIRRTVLMLAAIPVLLIPLACASPVEDDMTAPTVEREGQAALEGIRVELLVPAAHATHEQMSAIIQHVEGQADVAQAKAAIRQSSETGDAEVMVELWGQAMPTDQELASAVQTEFPFVAQVDISPIDPEAEAPPVDDAEVDPEVLRQQIIDDLRAKGVEGDIDVQITDHPDGRREVEVEVEGDETPPA